MISDLCGLISGFNQGATLEAAIRSLDGIPVFYFDSGSTDDSKFIAEKAGATVLSSVDPRNTGSIRNSIRKFTEIEYVITISCDDILDQGGIELIRDSIRSSDRAGAIQVTIAEQKQNHRFRGPRVWCPDIFRHHGRAHEILIPVGEAGPRTRIDDSCSATIIHTRGPWHENPSDATIEALKLDLAEAGTEDPRCLYYLGAEYFMRQNYEEALHWFQRRIKIVGHGGELADAYLHLGACYQKLGKIPEARGALIGAVTMNNHFKEAILGLAFVSHEHNRQRWLDFAATADNAGVLFVRG